MLFAAITIVTFNCCSENNTEEETPQTPYFEFVDSSDTAQMFPAEGGTAEIKFATSHDWTVSTDENWISLPRKSGTPSITHFTITVSQNTSTSQRTGIVTITSSNQSYEISITQEAIQIDDVAILMDDAAFISYCYANFDLNKDGKISIMEANTAKVIEIKEEPKLISVKGIEIFTNLERITAMGSALSSTAMAAMSLKTIFTSWSNEDMSFGEKLTSSLMAFGMLIPSVSGAFKGLLTVMGLTNM
jgi:hypothetical protein